MKKSLAFLLTHTSLLTLTAAQCFSRQDDSFCQSDASCQDDSILLNQWQAAKQFRYSVNRLASIEYCEAIDNDGNRYVANIESIVKPFHEGKWLNAVGTLNTHGVPTNAIPESRRSCSSWNLPIQDEIYEVEQTENGARVTSVTVRYEDANGNKNSKTIGQEQPGDSKQVIQSSTRYRVFGFFTVANDFKQITKLGLVNIDRTCNLDEDRPLIPENFQVDSDVTKTNRFRITLTWEQNTRGGPADNFELQYAELQSNTWIQLALTPDFSYTAATSSTALESGKDYRFRIRSIAGDFQTQFSDSLIGTVARVPGAPGQPDTKTASLATGSATTDIVTITWSGANDGGSPITSYIVQVKDNNGVFKTADSCSSSLATTCEISYQTLNIDPFNLPWGSKIVSQVQAQNKLGLGAFSSEGGTAVILSAPEPVSSFVELINDRTENSLKFEWTVGSGVTATGGSSDPLWYSIQVTEIIDGQLSQKIKSIGPIFEQNYFYQNGQHSDYQLQIGSSYEFKISVFNGWRESQKTSSTLLFALKPDPSSNVDSRNNKDQIELWWNRAKKNGAEVTEYFIYIQNTVSQAYEPLDQICSYEEKMDSTVGRQRFTCIFSVLELTKAPFSLQGGNQVNVQVIAKNEVGLSDPAFGNGAVMKTPPRSPSGLQTQETAITRTEISFTWTQVPDEADLPVVAYTVYKVNSNQDLEQLAQLAPNVLEYTTTQTLTLMEIYTFVVTASNAIGESQSSTPIQIVSADVPAQPVDLKKINEGSDHQQVKIQWQAASDNGAPISAYKVLSNKNDGINFVEEAIVPASQTEYTITGLFKGFTYKAKVQAINIKGLSPAQTVEFIAATKPSAVTDAIVTMDYQTAKAIVSWSKGDNGGVPISSYKVYARNVDSQSDYQQVECTFSNQLDQSCTINFATLNAAPFSVAWGKPFMTQITAINEFGESARAQAKTQSPTSNFFVSFAVLLRAPDSPINVGQDSLRNTQTSVMLTWESGLSNGGTEITKHKVEMASETGIFTIIGNDLPDTPREFNVENLVSGQSYKFRVTASNSVGDSPASAEYNLDPFEPILPPQPPFELNEVLEQTNQNQITFTWKAPIEDGGATITDYRVWYQLKDDPLSSKQVMTGALGRLIFTVTDSIESGKEYQVKVQALNDRGYSQVSESINIIAAAAPAAPTGLVNDPSVTDASQIRIQWQAPNDNGSPITKYHVYNDANINRQLVQGHTITATEHIETSLQMGQTYRFKVVAENVKGRSPDSEIIQILAAQKPPAPNQPLVVQSSSDDLLIVEWSIVNDGGSPLTDKTVRVQQATADQKMTEVVCNRGTTDEQCSIEVSQIQKAPFDLDWGSLIYVTVSVSNIYGTSEQSAKSEAVKITTVPDAPINIQMTEITTKSMTFSFEDGSNLGGLPILDYRVYQSVKGGQFSVIHENQVGKQFIADNLQDLEIYIFQVQARNEKGYSPVSQEFEIKFDPLVEPNPPQQLVEVASQTTASQVGLSWQAPAVAIGPPLLDYIVEFRVAGTSDPFLTKATVVQTNYVATDLQQGTSYEFQIRSRNKDGQSEPSNQIVALAAQVPAVPNAPIISFKNKVYTISWERPDNGGSAITGFKVHLLNSSGSRFTQADSDCVPQVTSTVISCQLNSDTLFVAPYSLVLDDQFSAVIIASNILGDSQSSQSSSLQSIYDRPRAPTNLNNNENETNNQQITFQWQAPVVTGGIELIEYRIQVFADEQLQTKVADISTANVETKYTFTQVTAEETYYFVVVAVNEMGQSPQSDSIGIVAEDLSFPPRAVETFENDSEITSKSQIGLKWSLTPLVGEPPILRYIIYWKNPSEADSQFKIYDDQIDAATTKLTISELTSSIPIVGGQSYDFKISAVNKKGEGAKSSKLSVIAAGTPSAPTNLSFAFNKLEENVGLTFTQSDNNGLRLQNYNIKLEKDSQLILLQTCPELGECLVLFSKLEEQGIQIGMIVKLYVSAVNQVGESANSDPFEQLWAFPPMQPVDLQNDPAITQDNQIGLKWSAPSDTQGADILGYKIFWKLKDDSDYKELQVGGGVDASINTLTIRSITPQLTVQAGQAYDFKVLAFNVKGDGQFSNEVQILAASVPSAPIVKTPELIGETQIKLTFEKQASNGANVIGYRVEIEHQDKSQFSTVNCDGADALAETCTIQLQDLYDQPFLLQIGDQVVVNVYIVSKQGDSPPGQNNQLTIAFISTPPQNLRNNAALTSSSQIGLLWDAPSDLKGSTVNHYNIYMSFGADTRQIQQIQETSYLVTKDSFATQFEFIAGQTYSFRVTAQTDLGETEFSNEVDIKAASAPSAPTNVQLSYSEENFSIEWTESVSNGATITGYKVQMQPKDAQNYVDFDCVMAVGGQLKCSAQFEQVLNTPFNYQLGDTLQVQVYAQSQFGDSLPSTPATSKLAFAPLPVVLQNDKAVTTNTQIGLKWNMPDDQGEPIQGYEIIFNNKVIETTTSNKLKLTQIEGILIEAGKTYDFQIIAFNSKGKSQLSNTETVLAASVPAAPTITQLSFTQDQLIIKWQDGDSNGATFTGAKILVSNKANDFTQAEKCDFSQANTCGYDFNELLNDFGIELGDKPKFIVVSESTFGDSAESEAKEVFIAFEPSKVLEVKNDPAVTTDQQIGLQWKKPLTENGDPITCYIVQVNSQVADSCVTETNYKLTALPNGNALVTGEEYKFTLQAKNTIGVSELSDTVIVKAAITPVKISAASISIELNQLLNKVTVQWAAPEMRGSQLVEYKVYAKNSQGSPEQVPCESSTINICQFSADMLTSGLGLSLGDTIILQISTLSNYGESALSDQVELLFAYPPDAPQELENNQQITSGSQIGVEWKAPINNQGASIQNYILKIRESGATSWQRQFETSSSSFTVKDGIISGKEYIFEVVAVNQKGMSKGSEQITILAAGRPFPIQTVQVAVDALNRQIVVDFQSEIQNNNGADYTGYKVYLQDRDGQPLLVTCNNADPMSTKCIFKDKQAYESPFNLKLGENLNVQVTALNQIGESSLSTVSSTLFAYPPLAPLQLRNNQQETSASQISLLWDEPSDNQGAQITKYILKYKKQSESDWKASVEVQTTKFTVDQGLEPGELYIFIVSAVNSQGQGDFSDEVSIKAAGNPLPVDSVDVLFNQVTDDITVSFNAPIENNNGASYTGFIIYLQDNLQNYRQVTCNDANPLNRKCKFSDTLVTSEPFNLQLGDKLKVAVQAVNEIGESVYSKAETDFISKPSKPLNLQREKIDSKTQIKLNWDQGLTDGGKPITGYKVSYTIQGRESFELLADGVQQGSYTTNFDNTVLSMGQTYIFAVQAVNELGDSERSTIVVQFYFQPDQVTEVKYDSTSITYDSVDLSWKKGGNGGSKIETIIISYKVEGASIFKETNAPGDLEAFTLKGLQANSEYQVFIQAVNIVGESVQSTQITFKTKAAPPVEEKSSTTLLVVISVLVLLLILCAIGIVVAICCYKKSKKQKAAVDFELNPVHDEEDPCKPDDSAVQPLVNGKSPIDSTRKGDNQILSTHDLNVDDSQQRLTEVEKNPDIEAIPEADEEDFNPSEGGNALQEMWKMTSPRAVSDKKVKTPRGDAELKAISPVKIEEKAEENQPDENQSARDDLAEQTVDAKVSNRVNDGASISADENGVSQLHLKSCAISKAQEIELTGRTMKEEDIPQVISPKSASRGNQTGRSKASKAEEQTIVHPEEQDQIVKTEPYDEFVVSEDNNPALEGRKSETDQPQLELKNVQLPAQDGLEDTARDIKTEMMQKRPPPLQRHVTEVMKSQPINEADVTDLPAEEEQVEFQQPEYDPKFDPHYRERFHNKTPLEGVQNVDIVRQSIYDEEAKEIVNMQNRFVNKVIKDSDHSGIDFDTMAGSGANKTDLVDEIVRGGELPPLEETNEDYTINKNMVSLGEPAPMKIKLKKKKTKVKKIATNHRNDTRTVWSAHDARFGSEEGIQDVQTTEEPAIVQPDPESEEILMMIQNLWEKKQLGCLSKLDKKLLSKLQKLVAENPKHYSGKIGYLQMIYQ